MKKQPTYQQLLAENQHLKKLLEQQQAAKEKDDVLFPRPREIYRKIIDSISLGIMLIDQNYEIIFHNSRFAQMFDNVKGNFAGKKCHQVFGSIYCNTEDCPGANALRTGKPQHCIHQYKGQDKWLKINAFAVHVPNIKFRGFVEIVEDVTPQIKAQNELKQYRQSLEKTIEARTAEIEKINAELRQSNRELTETIEMLYNEAQEHKQTDRKLREYQQNLEKLVHTRTRELRESEKRYRALFENSVDGFAQLGSDGNFIDCNPSFLAMLGYSLDEIKKLNFTQITPEKWNKPDFVQKIKAQLDEKGFVPTYEKEYIAKNGKKIPIELTAFVFRAQDQRQDCVWEIVRDISERKNTEKQLKKYRKQLEKQVEERTKTITEINEQLEMTIEEFNATNEELYFKNDRLKNEINERLKAEAAIKESEERMRSIFENTPVGICIINQHEKFEYVNPAFCFLFRFQPNELTRQPVSRIISNEFLSQIKFSFDKDQKPTPGKFSEWTIARKDAKELTVLINTLSIKNPAAETKQVLFVTDITTHKHAEHQLEQALKKEKELNRLQTNIVSIVSHEFRTPLSIILSSAELLSKYRHKLNENEQQQELTHIKQSVERMNLLISDMLYINKIEAGKQKITSETLDLVIFIRNMIDEMKNIDNKKQKIHLKSPKTLKINADKKILQSIFANLISNAMKYSEKEGEIWITINCEKHKIKVVVKDNGIGIPEKAQKNIFNMFHRAANVGNIQGTGLGLAIVKRSLEKINGAISFESKQGKGSSFTVELPLP